MTYKTWFTHQACKLKKAEVCQNQQRKQDILKAKIHTD